MRIVKMPLSVALSLFLLFGIYSSSFACATFMLKDKNALIVGHNVDFNSDYMPGYIFVNKRGIAKTNFTLNDMNGKWDWTPRIRWISKYGSVTFNPMVIELSPTAGINEAGLFIAEMSLTTTKYPTNPFLPNMIANQWIQYQLDNYRSVDEVLENIGKIVPRNDAPNHYFISDKRGKCACIEYIKGNAVIFREKSMPVPLLCNSEYPYELKLLKKYRGFGGTRSVYSPIEGTDTRFAQGAYMIEKYSSSPAKRSWTTGLIS